MRPPFSVGTSQTVKAWGLKRIHPQCGGLRDLHHHHQTALFVVDNW